MTDNAIDGNIADDDFGASSVIDVDMEGEVFGITSDVNLSYGKQLTKTILITISGMLSMFGSGSIIFFCRRKLDRLYHRLLFCLSLGDLLFSISYILQPWLIPADSPKFDESNDIPIQSYGNITSCAVIGFFFTCSALTVSLFNCFLSLYFKLTIVMGKTETFVIRKYEKLWYTISFAIPITICITTAVYDGYNPETYTRLCMFDGREFGIPSHGPTIGYVWVFSILVSSVVGFRSTYQVYRKVKDASIAMQRYNFHGNARSSSGRQHQTQQQQQRRRRSNSSSINTGIVDQQSSSSQFIQEHPRSRQLLLEPTRTSKSSLQMQQNHQHPKQHLQATRADDSLSQTSQPKQRQQQVLQENQIHERPTLKLSSSGGTISAFRNNGSGRNTTTAATTGTTSSGDITTAETATCSVTKRPFGVGGFHSLVRPGMRRQTSIMSTNTNRTTGSSNTTNTNSSSLNKVRAVATQAVLYSLAYLNSVSWPILVSIFAGAFSKTAGEMYTLDVLSSAFYPLQGFFNFFVFIRPTYIQWRRQFPHKSKLWALKQILEFHATSQSSSMSSADAAATAARRQRQRTPRQTTEQNVKADDGEINVSSSHSNIETTASEAAAATAGDTSTDTFRRSSTLLSVERKMHPPYTIEEVDDEFIMRNSGGSDENENDGDDEGMSSKSATNQQNDRDIESNNGVVRDAMAILQEKVSPIDKKRRQSQSAMHTCGSANARVLDEAQPRDFSLRNINEIDEEDGDNDKIKPIKKSKRNSFVVFSDKHGLNESVKNERRSSFFGLGTASRTSNRRMHRSCQSSSFLDPNSISSTVIAVSDDENGCNKQRRTSLQSFLHRNPRAQRSSRRKTLSEINSSPSIGSRNISLSAFYDLDLHLNEDASLDDLDGAERDDGVIHEDVHYTDDTSRQAVEDPQISSSQRAVSLSALHDLDLLNSTLDENVDYDSSPNLDLKNRRDGSQQNNTHRLKHPMNQSKNGLSQASWSNPEAFSPSPSQWKKQQQLRSQRHHTSRTNLLQTRRSSSNSSFFTSLSRKGWSAFWRTGSRDGLLDDKQSPTQWAAQKEALSEQKDGDFGGLVGTQERDPGGSETKVSRGGRSNREAGSSLKSDEDILSDGRPVSTGLRFLQHETGFSDAQDITFVNGRSQPINWDGGHNVQYQAANRREANGKVEAYSRGSTSMVYEFSSSSTVDA